MKTTFLILLNKAVTAVCNLFGRDGSVFPASLVRPLDKDILEKIKYPKYVIGVTGSSGKGSTTSMIAHILEDNGLKVVWNKTGSNVVNGTTTLILNNTKTFSHQMDCDVLLLEIAMNIRMGSSHQNVKQILLKLEKKGFVSVTVDESEDS